MKSLAFFNNKGGVGKTTLLCNVAAYLSIYHGKRICVVDADPQCNATQYFFKESVISSIYDEYRSFTIYNVIEPLSVGEGYSKKLDPRRSASFKVDVIPGDPRLALTEDLLAGDWGSAKAGDVRGIRTNLVFSELLSRLDDYDLVLFDVSPSLGAINRAILLAVDYFISPMSIDIFSLKAFENIAKWIDEWETDWRNGLANVKDKSRLPGHTTSDAIFVGYVTQQYLAKKDSSGTRRAVQAYENIRTQIDDIINRSLSNRVSGIPYEIGTVPNLFSLIPMSQSRHKPVFELTASDGIVGAHFGKVKDARDIFKRVADELVERVID